MADKRPRFNDGFTLIEIMITIVIALIAVLGTCAYRYNATLDTHKAQRYITAARTAMMLCESWRAVSDANTFDPTQLASSAELTIAADNEGPTVPTNFTALGKYTIGIDSVNYYATLSWQKVSGVRALNVVMAWDQKAYEGGDFTDTDKSFRLTTYSDN